MHKLSQVAARIVGEELDHGRGTVCAVASKYNLAGLSFNSASVTAKSFLTIVPSVNLRQPERNFKIFRSVTGHALEKNNMQDGFKQPLCHMLLHDSQLISGSQILWFILA